MSGRRMSYICMTKSVSILHYILSRHSCSLTVFHPPEGDDKWWEAIDLHTIDVSNNKIQSFPSAFFAIATTISVLILDNNELTDHHMSGLNFADLPALQRVSLAHNRLTRIPHSITELTALADLCVEDNALDSLPGPLLSVSTLTSLKLADNRIATVAAPAPPVAAWGAMVTLDLSSNALEAAAVGSLVAGLKNVQTLVR